jgi:hypothetical protein
VSRVDGRESRLEKLVERGSRVSAELDVAMASKVKSD